LDFEKEKKHVNHLQNNFIEKDAFKGKVRKFALKFVKNLHKEHLNVFEKKSLQSKRQLLLNFPEHIVEVTWL